MIVENFVNKKVLITQNDIYSINGSAIIVLELAQFLIDAGALVTVYTYFLHDPLKSVFENSGIYVTDSEDTLSLDSFDYVWVHQQVLPLSIISELVFVHKKPSMPIFIFNHMSSLDKIADEFPYIWNLENTLSSLSLFNSIETKNKQAHMLVNDLPKELYQNPAPSSFAKFSVSQSKRIERVLVVSNHPPKEIEDLIEEFTATGIELTILGENQEKYRLIDLELLSQYDVVITIGKTVQNCLVAGIPVYVYDHFGGPGYLNESNIIIAEENNFSGRGFEKKSTKEIYKEITEKYYDARSYLKKSRSTFIKKFTIENLLTHIFEDVRVKTYESLDRAYIDYLKASHNYSREHRIAARQRMVYKKEIEELRQELDDSNAQLESIKSSKSYNLGNKLAEPLRRLKTKKLRR